MSTTKKTPTKTTPKKSAEPKGNPKVLEATKEMDAADKRSHCAVLDGQVKALTEKIEVLEALVSALVNRMANSEKQIGDIGNNVAISDGTRYLVLTRSEQFITIQGMIDSNGNGQMDLAEAVEAAKARGLLIGGSVVVGLPYWKD
jgi:hypothetical protein